MSEQKKLGKENGVYHDGILYYLDENGNPQEDPPEVEQSKAEKFLSNYHTNAHTFVTVQTMLQMMEEYANQVSAEKEKENQELKAENERLKGDYEILSSYANIFRVKEQAKEIEELKELANDLFCGVEYLPKDIENKYKKLLNNKKQ